MCKGLASLPTCCLERYMKLHANTYMADVWGFGLQDMEDGTATLSLCVCVAKELKARLGSILQKPNWNLHCCKIGKNKPSLEECLRWKESFEKLLSSKYGLCAFTAFLVSEFSEENIAFYFACEDYRNTKSLAKLPAKAQKIYDEFICSDAPREINIDHETRDITKANMLVPSPSCFDLAQHKIYMLMAKDCYPRFLRSPAYRDLVSQAKPSTKKPWQEKKA
ncbi:regulator of G-protein signaling 5-like isoform X1 [Anabas testudineus]|uniref:RGS domain-containing protein n=1 Tax=Anabas testudineus TaxID=64144 RepID=A0A3Q1HAF0_ANATE|nr:regulator of G-protein signaling 5-like isoform X1 [Anabas testudineus]